MYTVRIRPAKQWPLYLDENVAESIILYAASIWTEESSTWTNLNLLNRTQKIGLARIASAYRSVPLDTLAVITGCIPWHIKVKERAAQRAWEIFFCKNIGKTEENRESSQAVDTMEEQRRPRRRADPMSYHEANTERRNKYDSIKYSGPKNVEFNKALQKIIEASTQPNKKNLRKYIKNKLETETTKIWQKFWDEAEIGRWTHFLIPNIHTWKERGVGQLNFHLTQILTEHGIFNKFRHKIRKSDNAKCWYDHEEEDDPHHTIMMCDRWEEKR